MTSSKPDIEDIIKQWAWDRFKAKANKKEKRLLENENVELKIDWSKVTFAYETKYTPPPPAVGSGDVKPNVLYQTTFNNRTSAEQHYTFRAERSTKSTLTTTIEKGYTTGYEMSVKLSTPCSILEANAGFKRDISLSNSQGETIEEELRWSVESQLLVKAGQIMEASMNISEEEYEGTFDITTTIRGQVRAVYTNLQNNNSFIKAREGDIYEIIRWAREEKLVTGDVIITDGDTKSVVCKTSGKCKFKYGIKQEVDVKQVQNTASSD